MKRFTVWEISSDVKELLESSYRSIEVEGEISNCKFSSAGHLYFSLKDSRARLQCVLFRSSLARVPFMPEDGQHVVASGGLSLYAPSGSYQLICRGLSLAGEGQILKLLEERKRTYAQLGYFDSKHKRPLPRFPRRIGIVTSREGAALRDILNVLERRNSRIHIVVLHAAVQGSDSAKQISQQIARANKKRLCDVLIVTRGGGAIEDLLSFSSEEVVKAIYDSNIPVISGVGHEIDWVLSDYAADVRAPTPSAAAEIVTGEIENLISYISGTKEHLRRLANEYIKMRRLEFQRMNTGSLTEIMFRRTGELSIRVDSLKDDVRGGLIDVLGSLRSRIALIRTEIQAMSPESVLKQGYGIIVQSNTDLRVFAAAETRTDQRIKVYMHDGPFEAVVTDMSNKNKGGS